MAPPVHGAAAPHLPATLCERPGICLVDGAEWSGAEVSGDFSARSAAHFEVSECRVVGAQFTSAQLPGARLMDVVFAGCDLSGAVLTAAVLSRVEFRDCRLLGTSFAQARLRDTKFTDCRLDDSDFRMSTGERAEFDHCSLVRGDFYAARLHLARLFDCDLSGAEFSRADMAGGRLHGSKLEALRGATYLSGVTISSAQVLPLAVQVLSALGITVDDEREVLEG